MTQQTTPPACAASSTTKRRDIIAATAVALVLSACGGGSGAKPNTAGSDGEISGLVVKGRVGGATITAYRLDANMVRGSTLASGSAAADGTFKFAIPAYNGHVEIVATSGTYTEESVGIAVQLTRDLSFVLPNYQSGTKASVTVSPISTIARAFQKAEMARGYSFTDANSNAWTHLNAHFGALDWRNVVPTDLTPADPITVTMSSETKAALILAGLSQAAKQMAQDSGLSPATAVTASTLAGDESADAQDGTLDGNGPAGQLRQGSVALNGQTPRRTLGLGILAFVQDTTRNKTQLRGPDVYALATMLASNGDPYLFCPNQQPVPSCAGSALQLDAPAVTIVNPPMYVGAKTVTLQVTASQPVVGVSAVYAQTLTMATPNAAIFADGVWTVKIDLQDGANLIKVWAVDGVGDSTLANASQTTIVSDMNPPTPTLAGLLSYCDERALTLVDASVPPTYRFGGQATCAAKLDPFVAGVYKAASRLAWTTQPTPAVLEAANPDNVPFIQIAVPVSPSEAPIQSATYSISDGANTYTGVLCEPQNCPWLSPASDTSFTRYDLPLNANTVPSLGTTSADPVSLSIVVTVTDAAGNTSTNVAIGTGPVAFHVVGPPVWVARDDTYASIADPNSTFPYYVSNNTYSTLWGGSFIDGQIRLVRYIVSNPTSVWAALTVTPSATWSMSESLSAGGSYEMPCNCGNAYCADNFTYQGCGYVDSQTGSWTRQDWSTRNFESICGWQTNTYGHRGFTSMQFECFPGTSYPAKGGPIPVFETGRAAASGGTTAGAFQNPQPLGAEKLHAGLVNGWWLVPPANILGPGQLVVYVTRPVVPRSSAAYPFSFSDVGYSWTGGWSGQNWAVLMARDMSVASATESLNGTVSFTAQAVTPAKDARFGATLPTGSDTFSNSQLTTH